MHLTSRSGYTDEERLAVWHFTAKMGKLLSFFEGRESDGVSYLGLGLVLSDVVAMC